MVYIIILILLAFLMFSFSIKMVSDKNKKNIKKASRKDIINIVTKVAIFSGLSYILYFIKFNLPFIFPSFLEINFSMLPILLAGFVLGPWWGTVVILIRFLLKLPFSSTAYVGELADLIIGMMVLIPSSVYYQFNKTKKGGAISLIIAVVMWVIAGVVTNIYINIPFYVDFYFGSDITPLVNMVAPLYKGVTAESFMRYYILLGVIPFNLVLSILVCSITFFVYKRISIIFKKDFFKKGTKK